MNKVWYQVLKHVENMYAYFIRQVSQSSYKLLILFESYTVDYGPGIHESPIRKNFFVPDECQSSRDPYSSRTAGSEPQVKGCFWI